MRSGPSTATDELLPLDQALEKLAATHRPAAWGYAVPRLAGIALSAIKLLLQFSNLHLEQETSAEDRKTTSQPEGAATFLGPPKLAAELERVPNGAELHLDFEHFSYIDHACPVSRGARIP